MAKTREDMKKALRASALGVTSLAEYDRELREFIAAQNPSMAEMAEIGLEVLQEP
jgi:hypothetical protein